MAGRVCDGPDPNALQCGTQRGAALGSVCPLQERRAELVSKRAGRSLQQEQASAEQQGREFACILSRLLSRQQPVRYEVRQYVRQRGKLPPQRAYQLEHLRERYACRGAVRGKGEKGRAPHQELISRGPDQPRSASVVQQPAGQRG